MALKNLLIKDLIRQIHKELIESQTERENENLEPLFSVESLKIEANFVAVDDQQAEAGFGFHLLKAGGKINYKQEQIHKITLNLTTIEPKAPSSTQGKKAKKNKKESSPAPALLSMGGAPSIST